MSKDKKSLTKDEYNNIYLNTLGISLDDIKNNPLTDEERKIINKQNKKYKTGVAKYWGLGKHNRIK
jgi:hypothetical protein